MIFLLWWNYRAYIISIDYTDWIVVQCRPIRFERQRVGRTRVWICQHKVMTGRDLLNQQIPKKTIQKHHSFFEALFASHLLPVVGVWSMPVCNWLPVGLLGVWRWPWCTPWIWSRPGSSSSQLRKWSEPLQGSMSKPASTHTTTAWVVKNPRICCRIR